MFCGNEELKMAPYLVSTFSRVTSIIILRAQQLQFSSFYYFMRASNNFWSTPDVEMSVMANWQGRENNKNDSKNS